jgi:hypothetical protein
LGVRSNGHHRKRGAAERHAKLHGQYIDEIVIEKLL